MCNLDKLSEFQKKCIINCLDYKKAQSYKYNNKNLSEEQVIEKCREIAGYSKNQVFTTRQYCIAAGIDESELNEFISDAIITFGYESISNLHITDLIINYLNNLKCNTIEDICYIATLAGYSVSVPRFKGIQRKNPDWTKDEILTYCILNESKDNIIYKVSIDNKEYNLSELCRILEVAYESTRRYVVEDNKVNIDKLLELTDRLYVNILGNLSLVEKDKEENTEKQSVEPKTLKERCEELGINYNTFKTFKQRHKISDNELIFKCLSTPDKLTTKDLCIINHVEAKKVYKHLELNPDKNVKKAIKYVKAKQLEENKCQI